MARKTECITRREIYNIACSYASSPDDVSAAHYCEQYDISEAVFYHCLEMAVRESMVTDVVANKIATKAARNGERHGGEGARVNSLRHYQALIDERPYFRFNKRDQKKYAEMYAESPYGFSEFCKMHYIKEVVMQAALVEVIQNGRIDDACVERIYQKSKERHGAETADRLFDSLKNAREIARNAKKEHERDLRRARNDRKKAEQAKADVEKQKACHRKFVQETMDEFGIPDELKEQKESLGIISEEE